MIDGGWRWSIRSFRRIARRPWAAMSAVFAASLCSSLFAAAIDGIPPPRIADEFSYLLMAETFASGHVAMPSHPLWEHFESFHIIAHPVYASKYPPAQSVALALGIVLAGAPIWGVWVGLALAASAVCWALRPWVGPTWALVGGLIAASRFGLFGYWAQSYWGGGMSLLGGALLVGAAIRLDRRPQIVHVVWLLLGLAILAFTRPYEGFVLAVLVLLWLAWRMFRQRSLSAPLVATFAAGCIALVAGLGIYHYNVTGDPLLMPYRLHESQYAYVSPVSFLPRAESAGLPVYRHKVLRDYWVSELDQELLSRDPILVLRTTGRKLLNFWGDYIGIWLAPLFFAGLLFGGPWTRAAAIGLGIYLTVAIALSQVYLTHYAAPAGVLTFGILTAGLAKFSRMEFFRKIRWNGWSLGRALFCLILIGFSVRVGITTVRHIELAKNNFTAFPQIRQDLKRRLEASGGKHLVVVRYAPGHNIHREWVYNSPDIDSSTVVWAREMDPAADKELMTYFNDRTVWLLEADQNPVQIQVLSTGPQSPDALAKLESPYFRTVR